MFYLLTFLFKFSVLKPEYFHTNTGRLWLKRTGSPVQSVWTQPPFSAQVRSSFCILLFNGKIYINTTYISSFVELFTDRDVCKKHWHSGEVIIRCPAPAFIRNFKAWETSAIMRALQFLPSIRNHQHYRLHRNEEVELDLYTGLQEYNELSTRGPWKPIISSDHCEDESALKLLTSVLLHSTKGPQSHSSKYKWPVEAYLEIDLYQGTSIAFI